MRDGHRVTLLERDPAPPPAPADAWDEWERLGVNQFRLPYGFLPRFTRVLEAELPDVLEALVDAGPTRANRLLVLPEAVTGGHRPGDERFDAVTARRVAVRGLVAEAGTDRPVHVGGVVTDTGERIDADLVVDAGGRRSALPDLLEAVGAPRPHEWRAESGYIYFVRNYRRADGSLPAPFGPPPIIPYDSISVAMVLVASAKDTAMRRARKVDVWERILRSYPLSAHWLDAEPIGDIDVIAKLEDRVRRLVVDGRPVATGVVAVADATASTDPSLGRGASIGLLHVCCLRDVLREVGTGQRLELVRRFDETTEQSITPLVDEALRASAHRLAQIEAQIAGAPNQPVDPAWYFGQSLAAAARSDPELLRAQTEIGAMLARGVEVAARPGRRERVAAVPPAHRPPGRIRAALLRIMLDEAA